MIIEVKNINIKEILFSGSCFRAKLESDGSITNIIKDRVVNLKQEDNKIIVKSNNLNNIEEILYDYFDLNRDYDLINKELIKKDKSIKDMIDKCRNYRILNQDPFEMCISYIISQNNNVKRISKSINLLCEKYGKKVSFNNKDYYLFPKYSDLKDLTINDFRELGVGFRDKYLKDYLEHYSELNDIDKLNTNDALKCLMKVKGIGLKVASCILLFGYKRLDVFPIDTWVKHYMVDNYQIKDDMKDIKEYALSHFGEYSGLVIQYMFHSKRNIEE